jgi:hypothetical protein
MLVSRNSCVGIILAIVGNVQKRNQLYKAIALSPVCLFIFENEAFRSIIQGNTLKAFRESRCLSIFCHKTKLKSKISSHHKPQI